MSFSTTQARQLAKELPLGEPLSHDIVRKMLADRIGQVIVYRYGGLKDFQQNQEAMKTQWQAGIVFPPKTGSKESEAVFSVEISPQSDVPGTALSQSPGVVVMPHSACVYFAILEPPVFADTLARKYEEKQKKDKQQPSTPSATVLDPLQLLLQPDHDDPGKSKKDTKKQMKLLASGIARGIRHGRDGASDSSSEVDSSDSEESIPEFHPEKPKSWAIFFDGDVKGPPQLISLLTNHFHVPLRPKTDAEVDLKMSMDALDRSIRLADSLGPDWYQDKVVRKQVVTCLRNVRLHQARVDGFDKMKAYKAVILEKHDTIGKEIARQEKQKKSNFNFSRSKKCYNCGAYGHLASACKQPRKNGQGNRQ